MSTRQTSTISVTIDAPFEGVVEDLADPATHPEWATQFFAGPATKLADGTYEVQIPSLGGAARMSSEVESRLGVIDLFLAPAGGAFGPPLPIRVVPNGDGVDVLFTLARFAGMGEEEWTRGLEGMRHELDNLKTRHEGR